MGVPRDETHTDTWRNTPTLNVTSCHVTLHTFTLQEHHEVLEEVRCLRVSTKRSAEQRDNTEKEDTSPDAAEENKILRRRNTELHNSVG